MSEADFITLENGRQIPIADVHAMARGLGVAHVRLALKHYRLDRAGKTVLWMPQQRSGQWRRVTPKAISKKRTRRTELRELRRMAICMMHEVRGKKGGAK